MCMQFVLYAIYIIYTTVRRSIANIYNQSDIFTGARSTEVNICLSRLDIEAMDRLTMLHRIRILYGECTTSEPFRVQRLKNDLNNIIFLLESVSLICNLRVLLNS